MSSLNPKKKLSLNINLILIIDDAIRKITNNNAKIC